MISINDIVNLALYGGQYRTIIIVCNKYRAGISFGIRNVGRLNPEILDFPVDGIRPSNLQPDFELEVIVSDEHFEIIDRIRN